MNPAPVTVLNPMARELPCRALIASLPLFRDVARATLDELARAAHEFAFKKGDHLAYQGGNCDFLLTLRTGRVKICRSRGGLWEQTLAEVGPGSPISLIPVLDGDPCPAHVVGIEGGIAVRVPGDAIRAALRSDASLAMRLLQGMASRVRGLVDLTAELSLLTLEERLARFLLKHAPGSGNESEAAWHFSHEDIANRIGGCREEVTRLLGKLKKKGLIKVARRQISIVDRPGLERLVPRDVVDRGCGIGGAFLVSPA